jgi:hypothetical protein
MLPQGVVGDIGDLLDRPGARTRPLVVGIGGGVQVFGRSAIESKP